MTVEPITIHVSGWPYSDLPLQVSGVPLDLISGTRTIHCIGVDYGGSVSVMHRESGRTIVTVWISGGLETTETGIKNLRRLAQKAINRFDAAEVIGMRRTLDAPPPGPPPMSDADAAVLADVML